MRLIRHCPLLLIILNTGFLFTLIAVGGKGTLYGEQEYKPLEAPVLSLMFMGIQDEIYPWQLFDVVSGKTVETAGKGPETVVKSAEPSENTPSPLPTENPADLLQQTGEGGLTAQAPTLAPTEAPTPYVYGADRIAPVRVSSEEEAKRHVSADIYGDAGVLRAAAYPFVQGDESFFDDALFIGDSRTVGLRDYTDLSEHAAFYCETSLTIYKVLDKDFKNIGTIKDGLTYGNYKKIYIMIGINELGSGTTEEFLAQYTKVVDTLHAWAPDARIIIQSIMGVAKQKSESDKIFNRANIIARNNAIATLADNETIFYVDINQAVSDEEGYLKAEYTFDQVHLLGVHYDVWKRFLLAHCLN